MAKKAPKPEPAKKMVECPECDGVGYVDCDHCGSREAVECDKCDGVGEIEEAEDEPA